MPGTATSVFHGWNAGTILIWVDIIIRCGQDTIVGTIVGYSRQRWWWDCGYYYGGDRRRRLVGNEVVMSVDEEEYLSAYRGGGGKRYNLKRW